MGIYYYTEYEPLDIQTVLGRFYIKMLFRARQRMCSSHMLGVEGYPKERRLYLGLKVYY